MRRRGRPRSISFTDVIEMVRAIEAVSHSCGIGLERLLADEKFVAELRRSFPITRCRSSAESIKKLVLRGKRAARRRRTLRSRLFVVDQGLFRLRTWRPAELPKLPVPSPWDDVLKKQADDLAYMDTQTAREKRLVSLYGTKAHIKRNSFKFPT